MTFNNAAQKSLPIPSSSTSAYCLVRKNLDKANLESTFQHTSGQLEYIPDMDYLDGRRVIVVYGTGVSMPDTDENQLAWP